MSFVLHHLLREQEQQQEADEEDERIRAVRWRCDAVPFLVGFGHQFGGQERAYVGRCEFGDNRIECRSNPA